MSPAHWKGEAASKSAKHCRITRVRGAEKYCTQCETRDPAKKYEWANLTGDYDDIWDFARMCTTCHRIFDKNAPRLRAAHQAWLDAGGRPNPRPSHCHKGHELSGANEYVNPTNGFRQCRKCGADRARERYRRRTLA